MTPGADFDPVAAQEALYLSRNPTRRWLHVARRKWVLNAVRDYTKRRYSRALEVGPGGGTYLPSLIASSERVTALDRERVFLEHARALKTRHPNLDLVVGNITECGMRSGAFQLILCSEVIEHVADSRSAFRELHRLLAPEGVLILTTPQRFSLLEQLSRIAYLPGVIRLAQWFYDEPVWDDGHVCLMTEGELRQRLDEVGLAVVEQRKMGVYIPLVAEFGRASALRLAKRLERRMQSGRLSWLLWTQCYVLKKEHPCDVAQPLGGNPG
jgi:SAM-dependent methyltransferase